jgi:hypothetical protein
MCIVYNMYLLVIVLSVHLRFTDYDHPLVSSNSSYNYLCLSPLTLWVRIPLKYNCTFLIQCSTRYNCTLLIQCCGRYRCTFLISYQAKIAFGVTSSGLRLRKIQINKIRSVYIKFRFFLYRVIRKLLQDMSFKIVYIKKKERLNFF